MDKKHISGFTLLELLTVIVVIGVVLSFGISNLSGFTQNSRMTSTANDLHSSFLLARTTASRAKSNVTLCASANAMDDDAACGGTLANGWIVFVDANGDIVRDAGENVIRRFPAIPEQINVTTNGGATYFSFAPTGLGRGDVNGTALRTALLCDSRGNVLAAGGSSAARVVVITPIGRSNVMREVDQIDAATGGCP